MLQPTLPTQIETTSLIKVNADIQTKCRIFGHWCVFFFLVALFTLTSIAIPTSTIEAGIQSHQFCNEYNVTADFLTTVCPSDGRIHSYYYISKLEKTNLFVFIEGQFDFYNRMGLETADLHINYTIDVWTVHSDQDETFYLDSLVANNQQHLSSKCEQFKYQEGDNDDDRRMLQGGNGQSPNGQNPNGQNPNGQNPRPQNGTIPNNTNNVSTNTSTNVTTNNSTTNISNNTSADPTSDTLDSADEQVYDPDRLLCGWDVILYEPLIEQSNLFVHVAMQYQPDTYIEMRGSMAASEYTNSLIAIRYVFLLTSIITGIIYYCNLRQLQKKFWVIEQVFVLIQSILLPFFNDPLYAATVLTPNRGTAVIGVLFFSNFISFLLLFWLVQYDRIVNENGKKESRTINLPKLVVIALLWITLVVAYIILTLAYFNNPTLNFDNVHNRAYKAFQIMSLILAFLILLYILRYLILFCRKYDSVLWRYKLIGLFNIFFILCLGLFLATGSFSLYNFQGTQVLICISILNLYVFYMQYLWTPSQVGLIEQKTMDEMSNQQSQMNNNAYDELEIDNIEIEANSQHQVIDEKLIEQPVMQ